MERRTFLKFLAVAPAVAVPVLTAPAPAPLVAQPPVAAEGIQASNLEAQQQQWSQTHGG